jgi:hypothetical protein
VKQFLVALVVGGLFCLGCSPSGTSKTTTKTPTATKMEEKSGYGETKKTTEMKGKEAPPAPDKVEKKEVEKKEIKKTPE